MVEFQPMRGEQTLSWDFREISAGRVNTLFFFLRAVTKMEEVLMETTAPNFNHKQGGHIQGYQDLEAQAPGDFTVPPC